MLRLAVRMVSAFQALEPLLMGEYGLTRKDITRLVVVNPQVFFSFNPDNMASKLERLREALGWDQEQMAKALRTFPK